MPLRTCGTVVEREHDRVIVRIEKERCVDCTGCVRFKFPKTVHAIGTQAIGERVAVRSSASQLSIAALLVFGLPVVTLALTLLIWESIWVLGVSVLLSVVTVFGVMRITRLQRLFRIYAEQI